MAQFSDRRTNEFRGSIDGITGETVTDLRDPVGLIAAVNGEVIVDLNGTCVVLVDIRGTFVGTVNFEATVDGVNYVALSGINVVTQQATATVASTNLGPHAIGVTGFRRFRVRCSAFTSGSIAVAMRASSGDYAIIASPLPASLSVTVTAAAGAAATLTIASAGIGLFHYITRLAVERFFATAGLAAATPTLVTTTNLPGSRALSFPTAGAAGTMYEKIIEPAQPLKSSAAATATTIVCPVSADTIWRVTADYYVGA